MTLAKRFVVLGLFVVPLLAFAALFMAWTSGLDNSVWLAKASVLFNLLAWPLLLLGYNLQRSSYCRSICGAGLLFFALGAFCTVGGYCYKNMAVWQPEEYQQLKTAEVLSASWNYPQLAAATLEPADAERLAALWQQVSYRNPCALKILPEGSMNDLFAQGGLCLQLANGEQVSVVACPPYYVLSYESWYDGTSERCRGYVIGAADEQICQAVYDLYAELAVKYASNDLGDEQLAAER